jgi:hypothetical protein
MDSDFTDPDSIEPEIFEPETRESDTTEPVDNVDRDNKVRRRAIRPIAKVAHMTRTIPAVSPGDTPDELEALLPWTWGITKSRSVSGSIVGVDEGVFSKGDVGAEESLLLEGTEDGKDEGADDGADDGAELLVDGADVVEVSMTGGLVASPIGSPMLIAACAPMLIPVSSRHALYVCDWKGARREWDNQFFRYKS